MNNRIILTMFLTAVSLILSACGSKGGGSSSSSAQNTGGSAHACTPSERQVCNENTTCEQTCAIHYSFRSRSDILADYARRGIFLPNASLQSTLDANANMERLYDDCTDSYTSDIIAYVDICF